MRKIKKVYAEEYVLTKSKKLTKPNSKNEQNEKKHKKIIIPLDLVD